MTTYEIYMRVNKEQVDAPADGVLGGAFVILPYCLYDLLEPVPDVPMLFTRNGVHHSIHPEVANAMRLHIEELERQRSVVYASDAPVGVVCIGTSNKPHEEIEKVLDAGNPPYRSSYSAVLKGEPAPSFIVPLRS